MAKLRVQHWLIYIYVHLSSLKQSLMVHLHFAISQHHNPPPTPPHSVSPTPLRQPHPHPQAASRDRLTLWSTSWFFLSHCYWIMCQDDAAVFGVCMGWRDGCTYIRMLKHRTTFWWLLGFDECAGDDNRAVILWTDTLGWPSCFRAFLKSHAMLPFFIHCICAPN